MPPEKPTLERLKNLSSFCPHSQKANQLRAYIGKVMKEGGNAAASPAFAEGVEGYDAEILKAERYATAPFVIESVWNFMSRQPDFQDRPFGEKIPLNEAFWDAFMTRFSDMHDHYKNDWCDGMMDAIKAKNFKNMTPEEAMFYRFQYAHFETRNRKGEEGKMGAPSPQDLVVFFAKLARAAVERFERSFEKPMDAESMRKIVNHPSFRRFFTDLMMNSRGESWYLMVAMENYKEDEHGKKAFYFPTEPKGSFDIDRFGFFDPETLEFGVSPTLVQNYRANIDAFLTEKGIPDHLGDSDHIRMGCPALFTPAFGQYFDWLQKALEYHYISQLPNATA